MAVVLKPTGARGVVSVHRREGEKPFAELHSPSSRGSRNWGIKFRGDNSESPFNATVFNSAPSDKESALYELNHAARVCSDYQLNLEEGN